MKQSDSLREISCDTYLKIKFEALSLAVFWIYIKKEHLELSHLATEVLLPFWTTYLYEDIFSAMAEINSKTRNRLHLERDLRVAVPTIQPKTRQAVPDMQAHLPHSVSSVIVIFALL
jgi:hypothetical protein